MLGANRLGFGIQTSQWRDTGKCFEIGRLTEPVRSEKYLLVLVFNWERSAVVLLVVGLEPHFTFCTGIGPGMRCDAVRWRKKTRNLIGQKVRASVSK
jgi:hypothetical protein